MLRQPKPIETPTEFGNKNKYCQYHEDFGYTTFECCELKKALHELADQRQLNHFKKWGKGDGQNHHNQEGKKDNDADCNKEVIATVVGGIDDKELNAGYRKAQIQKLNRVLASKGLKSLIEPIMTFDPEYMHPLQTPHNNAW